MRLVRSPLWLIALAGVAWAQGNQQPANQQPGQAPFGFGSLGSSKEPITVTSDTLEYDYRSNIVRYRGRVEVIQGDVKLVSDLLTITLEDRKREGKGGAASAPAAPAPPQAPAPAAPPPPQDEAKPTGRDASRVREIVAEGSVRIDQGPRWAVGGRAVFDQIHRTLVLTQDPVLHDGQNQVAGDRVIVFLDEDRSVVEGGQQRVKAVLVPDQQPAAGKQPVAGKKPGAGKPAAPASPRPAPGRAQR